MIFWVYILACKPKQSGALSKKVAYYVGSTSNLQRRIKEHKSGKSKYTQTKEVELVYCEIQPSRKAAVRREMEIKRKSKVEKEKIIKSYSPLLKHVDKEVES
jgi:putative endonuclease